MVNKINLFNFNEPTETSTCTACKQTHPAHFFIVNTKICKNCKSVRNKAYTDRLRIATPPWISKKDLNIIEQFKQLARDMSSKHISFEIDHIDALKGENSSGLNVPWNIQVITSTENKQKKNKNGLLGGGYE